MHVHDSWVRSLLISRGWAIATYHSDWQDEHQKPPLPSGDSPPTVRHSRSLQSLCWTDQEPGLERQTHWECSHWTPKMIIVERSVSIKNIVERIHLYILSSNKPTFSLSTPEIAWRLLANVCGAENARRIFSSAPDTKHAENTKYHMRQSVKVKSVPI